MQTSLMYQSAKKEFKSVFIHLNGHLYYFISKYAICPLFSSLNNLNMGFLLISCLFLGLLLL